MTVRRVELEDGIRVVHVATDDEGATECPPCGVLSTSLATRVGERLATDGEFRARVDGVSFILGSG